MSLSYQVGYSTKNMPQELCSEIHDLKSEAHSQVQLNHNIDVAT